MFNTFLEEEGLKQDESTIKDLLKPINSKILCWSTLGSFEDEAFNQYFQSAFGEKYLIYSLFKRDIAFESNKEKIIEFSPVDMPMFTLEFAITFAISAKNWLTSDENNVIIIHDNLDNVIV